MLVAIYFDCNYTCRPTPMNKPKFIQFILCMLFSANPTYMENGNERKTISYSGQLFVIIYLKRKKEFFSFFVFEMCVTIIFRKVNVYLWSQTLEHFCYNSRLACFFSEQLIYHLTLFGALNICLD